MGCFALLGIIGCSKTTNTYNGVDPNQPPPGTNTYVPVYDTLLCGTSTCDSSQWAPNAPKKQFEIFLQLLAPFAPHLTEELWMLSWKKKFIHTEKWPVYDEEALKAETVTIAVQVNGKMRGTISAATDADEKEVRKIAERDKVIVKHLAEHRIARVIYVKNRLLNFVLANN